MKTVGDFSTQGMLKRISDLESLCKELAYALSELLNDTQHKQHKDCRKGFCPVRDARLALAKYKELCK